jgi:hypothetical protein
MLKRIWMVYFRDIGNLNPDKENLGRNSMAEKRWI